MTREPKTAGLLPGPVWLLVRSFDPNDPRPRALGPIRTLERLKGLAEGIVYWANDGRRAIEGFAFEAPKDCKETAVAAITDAGFHSLEAITFEQQLINVLWYDYKENRWDDEKEWNADRWQDVGLLLEMFGIEFPGEDTPHPADSDVEDP